MNKPVFTLLDSESYVVGETASLINDISHVCSTHQITIATCFDLGAHVGAFGIQVAMKGCHVVAVEANPYSFAMLVANSKSNDFCIIPLCAAISSNRGPVVEIRGHSVMREMAFCSIHGPRHSPVIAFSATVTLQNLFAHFGVPELIKMDIQGEEFNVMSELSREEVADVKVIALERHDIRNPIEHDDTYLPCNVDLDCEIKRLGFVPSGRKDVYVKESLCS